MAVADRSGWPQALVICDGGVASSCPTAQLIEVNTTTRNIDRSVPLPPNCSDDYELAYDGRSGIAYVLDEPSNLSGPASLLGVVPDSGRVVTNISMPSTYDPWTQAIALGATPGTIYFSGKGDLRVDAVNASTGSIAQSFRVTHPVTSVWTDPKAGLLFVAPLSSTATDVLYESNLSLLRVVPLDGSGGVIFDHIRGEMYFVGDGSIGVARSTGPTILGTIPLPGGAGAAVYDSASDQIAGSLYGFQTVGFEVTNISRYLVPSKGFSAFPLIGSGLPEVLAVSSFVAGTILVAANWSAFRAARHAREEEERARFERWLNEGEGRT